MNKVKDAIVKEGGYASIERLSYAYRINITRLVELFELLMEKKEMDGLRAIRKSDDKYILLSSITDYEFEKRMWEEATNRRKRVTSGDE
ncbi:MAG: hypothetical protein QXQ33_00715 [Nitrososphaerota archaeon]